MYACLFIHRYVHICISKSINIYYIYIYLHFFIDIKNPAYPLKIEVSFLDCFASIASFTFYSIQLNE